MLNIVLLGLVSFFADFSSEMVYPLIPLYLTTVFGAQPALVGVIEGVAESAASLLKVFSGYLTDKRQHKKQVALLGYGTGLLYKLALLWATSWAGVLAARVVDRVGKGIRTAPRDVLVSESADSAHAGRAFGVHKALDMAGSAVGILAAYFLVRGSGGVADYPRVFALSILPVGVALVLLCFVREKRQPRPEKTREPFWTRWRALSRDLKLYLLVAFVFTLGNSSNTFLLLRAQSVGFSDTNVVLLYFLYNLVAALGSVPFGKLSDRVGRKRVLVAGYCTFALVYFGFAWARDAGLMIAVFALYGLYTAMTAGVERAFIAEVAPPELKGTMLGLHSTIVGVALLPASVIAGGLWQLLGPSAPFLLGGGLSLLAAALLVGLLGRRP